MKRYLIWSFEHDRWWAPSSRGYCDAVANAGRYTAEEALDILFHANVRVLNETAVPEEDAADGVWPAVQRARNGASA